MFLIRSGRRRDDAKRFHSIKAHIAAVLLSPRSVASISGVSPARVISSQPRRIADSKSAKSIGGGR